MTPPAGRGGGGGRRGQARGGNPPGRAGQPRRSGQPGRAGQVGRAEGGHAGRAGNGARIPSSPSRGGARSGAPDALGGEQVEGRQAVRELLRAGGRRIHQVLIADTESATGAPLAELAALARDLGVPVHSVARGRIDALALTDAPQGVVATADPVPVADLEDLLGSDGPTPLLVVLDGVTDPHNLGAVLRSALSAGATGAVLGRHRSAHLTPSAMKAAAGAAEYLPMAVVAGIPAALRSIQAAGVWTVGLDADGETTIWDLPVATEAVAVVLGAEGRGISRLVRDRCELVARVPMLGPLHSLNVSATAALACFEVARRRATPAD